MLKHFHPRLCGVVLLHATCAYGGIWLGATLNLLEPLVMPFANASFYEHYGVALDKRSFAWLWSTLAVSMNCGSLVGAMALARVLETWGRRDTCMVAANLLNVASALLHLAARSTNAFELLLVGRFVCGVSSTWGSSVLPLFMAECVADDVRGASIMLITMGGGAWVFVATLAAMPALLGSPHAWPYFFLVPVLPALVHLVCTPLVPRSPKFLYINERATAPAIDAVKFYHGPDVDINAVVAEFEREADIRPRRAHMVDKDGVSYASILRTRHLRIPLVLCLVASLSAQLNGNTIATQYGRALIEQVGIGQHSSTFVLSLVVLLVIGGQLVVSLYVIDRWGRRFLLLTAITVAVCGLLCFFASQLIAGRHLPGVMLGVVGIVFFTGSDVLGLTVISNLLIGELCPQLTRAKTASLAYSLSGATSCLLVLGYPPLAAAVGAFAVAPLVLGELVCFLFIYAALPETKNRPVDEIVAAWQRSPSADFSSETSVLIDDQSASSSVSLPHA